MTRGLFWNLTTSRKLIMKKQTKTLVIGGIYEHRERGAVELVATVIGGVFVRPLSSLTVPRRRVAVAELSPPTMLPCPYCGEHYYMYREGLPPGDNYGSHVVRCQETPDRWLPSQRSSRKPSDEQDD